MANLSSLIAPSGVLTAGADISELTNDAGYASQSDIDTSIANLAQGASGAPKITPTALSSGYVASLWTQDSNFVGVNNLLGTEELEIDAYYYGYVYIRYSDDNGATYGPETILLSLDGRVQKVGIAFLNLSTGLVKYNYFLPWESSYDIDFTQQQDTSSVLPSGPVNAFQLRNDGAGRDNYIIKVLGV